MDLNKELNSQMGKYIRESVSFKMNQVVIKLANMEFLDNISDSLLSDDIWIDVENSIEEKLLNYEFQ